MYRYRIIVVRKFNLDLRIAMIHTFLPQKPIQLYNDDKN